MACGFVYFLVTIKRSAPRYQPSSVLSAVVMVSAFLILFRQLLFTMADVFSKVIYGVILTNIAQTRSEVEDYQPALDLKAGTINSRAHERAYSEHSR